MDGVLMTIAEKWKRIAGLTFIFYISDWGGGVEVIMTGYWRNSEARKMSITVVDHENNETIEVPYASAAV